MNRDEHLSATAVCPLCGEKHSLSKCPRWTWTGSRDDVIRMAREAKIFYQPQAGYIAGPDRLERFATLVAAAEREACALACENIAKDTYGMTKLREYGECAAAIRARGEK